MTTAGNLVFAGEGNGSFNAYDATTGEKLWSFQAGAGVNSAPMSFTLDGKQYIAVAAGGNFQLNYKLGDARPGVRARLTRAATACTTRGPPSGGPFVEQTGGDDVLKTRWPQRSLLIAAAARGRRGAAWCRAG